MSLAMERVDSGLALLLLGLLAAGCESNVTPGEGGAGGGEVGGGEVGGGEVGGGEVGGGGGECSCRNAVVSFDIFDPDGIALVDPESGGETSIELTGSVHAPSPGVWEIDTCPPNADCLPSIYKVELSIPGLTPEIPEGGFVTLSSSWENFDGIEPREWIEIRNLPTWGGVANPVSSGEELWLFANVGMDDGAPLPITPVPHCSNPGSDPDGLDSFRVLDLQVQADNGPDGGPFTVQAGEVQSLSYASGVDAGEYMIANVSVCDGYEWYALQYGIARMWGLKR